MARRLAAGGAELRDIYERMRVTPGRASGHCELAQFYRRRGELLLAQAHSLLAREYELDRAGDGGAPPPPADLASGAIRLSVYSPNCR
ncbi:MAG TPA: hypothetical protein ENI87_09665 [bacterium]|nr:hypothetical protein [bacterium]